MTPESEAASAHDRLLAKTRASGGDFNLLLTRHALERFLYRISASRFQESFLLKGPSSSASGTMHLDGRPVMPTCSDSKRETSRR